MNDAETDGGGIMQDFLLLAAVTAIFVFGYVVMKKLDCVLEDNRKDQELPVSEKNSHPVNSSNSPEIDRLLKNTAISGKLHYRA